MLSRSSRNLKRRREALDLWIWSNGKTPQNCIIKEKSKEGWPRTTRWSCKQRTVPRRQRRTQGNGVSSIRAPLITQVSVEPRSHSLSSWRLVNQIHVLTLSYKPTKGMTKGSKLLMWSLVLSVPPPRSRRLSLKIKRRGRNSSTHIHGCRVLFCSSLLIAGAKRTSF